MICQLEEEDRREQEYPKLMKHKVIPRYILFINSTQGTILYDEESPETIGQSLHTLYEVDYEYFYGKIIMKND